MTWCITTRKPAGCKGCYVMVRNFAFAKVWKKRVWTLHLPHSLLQCVYQVYRNTFHRTAELRGQVYML